MGLWLWLFIAYKFIAGTCPLTSPVGTILNFITMVAGYVFVILTFFFAPHWWHGFFAIGAILLVPLVTPKINPANCSPGLRAYSMVFSHLCPVLIVLAYLSLFGVI